MARGGADQPRAPRRHGAMTQSTSPQVLMYASIDAARQQMATRGAELWRGAIELAEWARDRARTLPGVRCLGAEVLGRDGVASFDPTRLTISALRPRPQRLRARDRAARRLPHRRRGGRPAQRRAQRDLRRHPRRPGAARAPRCATSRRGTGDAGRRRLRRRPPACSPTRPPFTRQVLSPREAFFAPSVALPLAECAGRVSAEMVTPYPPGIPVLGPGEEISAEIVAYLQEARGDRAQGARPRGPHPAHAARRRLRPPVAPGGGLLPATAAS